MIDPELIRSSFDQVAEIMLARGVEPGLLDNIAGLDALRRKVIRDRDEKNAESNRISAEIGSLMRNGRGEDARDLRDRGKEVSQVAAIQQERLGVIEAELHGLIATLPNIPDMTVPLGDASKNKLIHEHGRPRDFAAEGFSPKDHVELGTALGILDMERGAKLAGARFSVLRGWGARLERALSAFMLDVHTGLHGYTEIAPPAIVSEQSLFGTGQLPKFKTDLFKLVDEREYYLSPTAEVQLTNLHYNEVLEEQDLPKWYVAHTPCFRSEAGSYGRDTRGLIRQHQFNKVELVKLCLPEDSEAEHQRMLQDAERILKLLGLPYRTILLSGGDMGFSATKTFDIEVWLPSQNAYREISSVSNCGDFQARRANIRFKRAGKKGTEFAHTLNGSGLAVGRTWLAVLENYQQADGSVETPTVLQRYLGVV